MTFQVQACPPTAGLGARGGGRRSVVVRHAHDRAAALRTLLRCVAATRGVGESFGRQALPASSAPDISPNVRRRDIGRAVGPLP